MIARPYRNKKVPTNPDQRVPDLQKAPRGTQPTNPAPGFVEFGGPANRNIGIEIKASE